jgi:hypothetical protein
MSRIFQSFARNLDEGSLPPCKSQEFFLGFHGFVRG